MKKHMRKVTGFLLCAVLSLSPVMEAAASNQFNVEAEDVAGKLIFPGDRVSGEETIYIGPDGTLAEISEGSWTNRTGQAYEMEGLAGEEEGLWLQPMGYVLTVNGGVSRLADTDGSERYNHYVPKESTSDADDLTVDIAYYEAWTDVIVKADEPKEGMVFDHWEVMDNAIYLEDASSPETKLTMTESAAALSAVYGEAPVEEIAEEPVAEGTAAEEAEPEGLEEINWMENPEEDPIDDPGETPMEGSLENLEEALWETPEEAPEEGSWEIPEEVSWETVEEGLVEEQNDVQELIDGNDDVQTQEDGVIVIGGEEAFGENEESAEPQKYELTVENGTGTGAYELGEQVTITADEIEGMVFAGWVPQTDTVWLADSSSQETTFFMPAEAATVSATYTEVEALPTEEEPSASAEGDSPVMEPEAAVDQNVEETPVEETQAPVEETPAEETQAPAQETPVEEAVENNFVQPESQDVETIILEEDETESEEITEAMAEETSYRIDLSDTGIQVNGAASENDQFFAKEGDLITVTAPDKEGQVFLTWRVVRSDTQENISVLDDTEKYQTASFVMPASLVYVEAIYEELNENEVQVVNGTGSGTYAEGDYVEIEANAAPEGQRFKKWTVITGNVQLDDSTSSETGFIMPDTAVQVKAEYEVIKYTLTVNYGSGSGSYAKGETISLTANYPASGKEFAAWKVTSGNASVSAADRYYSSITMPASNVTVEATYKDGPSPEYNEIQNIVADGEYLKGQTISFTAVGNGMGNANPNPGDYRYRPTGYQIGNVNGSWNNAPYTTSMAINAVGQYTLTVTFSKDVFDGGNWVADGTTVTKSVTFNVVNALSVQTGDSTPILPLAITAVAALIIIIALLLVRRRRK